MRPLVVGFDLDMTLIDTRPGIAAVWDALSAETGVPIDSAAAVSRLGPPLSEELAVWFPEDQAAAAGDRFRALYPSLAVAPVATLPGAREAVDAVRRHGGAVVVVTGKYEPNARLHLDHLGLDVDHLVGWAWGPQKGDALLEHGATVYVGDHVGDVEGARAAGAVSVGVPTGPVSAAELQAAGADVVLSDLTEFPAWLDGYLLQRRLDDLAEELGCPRVGGRRVLRRRRLRVPARGRGARSGCGERGRGDRRVSSSLPASELDAASRFAADLGVRHVLPETDEMSREGYRANAGDRCYFCKAELLDVLGPLAAELGVAHVATGTNADDARAGFRPGIRAAAERSAVTPLLDAGLTKAQVRAASRAWGLVTWDKPAAACLSSRVAFGLEISPARLARVERAEAAVRAALAAEGIASADVRVRDLGERARLEVDRDAVAAVTASAPVLAAVRAAGFPDVEVDPRGFRSGAMNELLPDPARYR